MYTYIHKIQYNETDKTGITHHSNYIRWMEEARIAFQDKTGYGYAKLELDGIFSPVIGVECRLHQNKRPPMGGLLFCLSRNGNHPFPGAMA